jgi:hypothetical protein
MIATASGGGHGRRPVHATCMPRSGAVKWWQIVLIVLGVALAALIAFGMWKESGARRKNVDDQISRNGWSRADSDPSMLTRWPGEPFNLGREYAANNVITGEYRGHGIVAFDLTFVARFGNQANATHEYSVYSVSAGSSPGDAREATGRQLAGMTTDRELAEQLTASGNRNRTFRLVSGDVLTWDKTKLDSNAVQPGHLEKMFGLLADVAEKIPADAWHLSH